VFDGGAPARKLLTMSSTQQRRRNGALTAIHLVIAAAFSVFFFVRVLPGALHAEDFWRAAFLDGFVNPIASGYSADTLATGLVLVTWIAHERFARGVRHGWVAALLTFVPGVAVGLAAYLVIRGARSADG
jgi:hypothetical protein